MFDVTRNGRQALIVAREHPDSTAETRPRIVLVLNWFEKLAERAGRDGASRFSNENE
jgi:hypothetical protein